MKTVKRILFAIVGLFLAACLGIVICALNPSLTDALSRKVQEFRNGPGADAGENGGNAANRGTGALPESVSGVNVDWLADRENTGYLVPGQEPGEPPAAVNGRTGYEPVSEDAQQVLLEESDVISPGELGEELAFDETYYPYYAMLEPDMKRLYCQIYANAAQQTVSFTPVEDMEPERVRRCFEAVYNDHPELFWLETSFTCKYLEDGTCVEIGLQYNETINDMEAARDMFLGQAETILEQARNQNGNYEKERYVHDALAELVSYDQNSRMNQSAFSGLVTARTVCAGYARAFQYLMQQLGIPCYYCTGVAGEDHAWNIVKLGEDYYNVDVTWDDTDTLTHDYFNRTDAYYAPTHRRTGLSVYLPACMGTAFGPDAAVETASPEDGEGEKTGQSGQEQPAESQEPMRPLTWEGNGGYRQDEDEDEEEEERVPTEEQRKADMERLGIAESELADTMEAYYADCAAQLKLLGIGEGQFSNVVPESLWKTVELAYSIGSYKNGYVDAVLKELGASEFYIQIQVQNLGSGYYRIYHNVVIQ